MHYYRIDGREVKEIRQINGQTVYILKDKEGDKEEIKAIAEDMAEATKGISFKSKK